MTEPSDLRRSEVDKLRESVRFWRLMAYAGWLLWLVAMLTAVTT